MDFKNMTYSELLSYRQEVDKAISQYHEREKIEVFTVCTFAVDYHFQSPKDAANFAIQEIKNEIDNEDGIITLFDLFFELKITKLTRAEFNRLAYKTKFNNKTK